VIVDDLAAPEGVDVDPKLKMKKKRVSADKSPSTTGTLPVFDLLRHRQESLFNIGSILSRSLEERDGKLIRKLLLRGH